MYSVHLEWRDYSIYNHRCCAAEDDHEGWRCDYAGTRTCA
jgi:exonuclease III